MSVNWRRSAIPNISKPWDLSSMFGFQKKPRVLESNFHSQNDSASYDFFFFFKSGETRNPLRKSDN